MMVEVGEEVTILLQKRERGVLEVIPEDTPKKVIDAILSDFLAQEILVDGERYALSSITPTEASWSLKYKRVT